MKFVPISPPREFEVGHRAKIKMKDCARIYLAADEQVTFVTESGAEYDVARKSWGFYATPSLNGRLRDVGWRAALIKGSASKFYIFLVERDEEPHFRKYLEREGHTLISWLDEDDELAAIERMLKSNRA